MIIDTKLLDQQRQILVECLNDGIVSTGRKSEALAGILNMLDAISDELEIKASILLHTQVN